MKVVLCTTVGTGRTELSAFDDALVQAGIGDYNLVQLSSVIPRGADLAELDDLRRTGRDIRAAPVRSAR